MCCVCCDGWSRLGHTFTFTQLLLWTASAGFLGVFYMPPLRHHMIVKQALVFPSGTATAYVVAPLAIVARTLTPRDIPLLHVCIACPFVVITIRQGVVLLCTFTACTAVWSSPGCMKPGTRGWQRPRPFCGPCWLRFYSLSSLSSFLFWAMCR